MYNQITETIAISEKKERKITQKIPWWGRSYWNVFSHTDEIIRIPQDTWHNVRAFDL